MPLLIIAQKKGFIPSMEAKRFKNSLLSYKKTLLESSKAMVWFLFILYCNPAGFSIRKGPFMSKE
jgi:hypothetical protein